MSWNSWFNLIYHVFKCFLYGGHNRSSELDGVSTGGAVLRITHHRVETPGCRERKCTIQGDLFSRIFLAPLDPFWMFAKRLVTVMTVCWIIVNYFLEWFAIMYWVQKFKFWGMWDAVSVLQAGQLPPDVMACRQQLLGHLSWGSPGTRQFWWLWWKSVKNIYNSLFRKKHNSNSIQWLEESLCKDLRV